MATVKLLLKESIKNVGRVGDVVEVSPGYARNYLLPQDLAVEPTPNNVKKIEERRKEIEKQERERREQQAALIKQLEGVEVTLERRANEQGHLFGSVTATDIAKALQAQGFNIEAGRRQPARQARPHRHVHRCRSSSPRTWRPTSRSGSPPTPTARPPSTPHAKTAGRAADADEPNAERE